jgi:hypothetical protein
VPEIVAVWLAGLVVLLLVFAATAAILRFTAAGRAQGVSPGELFKVLAVCITVACVVYTALVLVT